MRGVSDKRPKWDILILSVHSRKDQLRELLGNLTQQIAAYPDVNVIVLTDNTFYETGKKRTALLRFSKAQYISFIDDDDEVPKDYVATIYPYLDGVNDYVGFKVAYSQNGVPEKKPIINDASVERWSEDDTAWYRHISHLNPIKREIVRSFSFVGMAREDYRWSLAVKKSGRVKKAAFIDRPLYHYKRSDSGTLTARYR